MADSISTILTRLLANISDNYDKTEGSFFYDILKPIATELAKSYSAQETILSKGFAKTATGKYLDLIVGETGLKRKAASAATTTVLVSGKTGATISIGDKVASAKATFEATEDAIIDSTGITSVTVQCTTTGTTGNVAANTIKYFPITLNGITGVTNPSAVTNGYDEESDDDLRGRYFEYVQTPATSGNKYHYINWAKSVTGVGDAKCFPLWNGPGTVKVCIVNEDKKAASSDLIISVTNHIENNRPIGATVTVVSATELPVSISATITLSTNYTLQDVKESFEASVKEYLENIAFVDTYVSYAKIGSLLLDTTGVLDYTNLTVNNGSVNINIGIEETPVVGTISLEV